jgi:hypothetical protein
MSTRYLFQIDGRKVNDRFFEAVRTSPSLAYKGTDLEIGKGPWIPDLVQVDIEESPASCVLKLIELEDNMPDALAACRKYLPEDSADILSKFYKYLDRITEDCRSHADNREHNFVSLKEMLRGVRIEVHTACALRSSIDIIEELSLIGQPRLSQPPEVQQNSGQDGRKENEPRFQGLRGLSGKDVKALGRCVMVLDAVIRCKVHSGATFKSWQVRAPLKSHPPTKDSPILKKLVIERRNSGMELDFENLIKDLVAIWQERYPNLQQDDARLLIRNYFQVASQINRYERMETIFAAARKHLAGLESPDKSGEGTSTSS